MGAARGSRNRLQIAAGHNRTRDPVLTSPLHVDDLAMPGIPRGWIDDRRSQSCVCTLHALALAVTAIRRRFPDVTASAWALISVITGGRLLLPAPSG
jgi:hypothetical protein